MMQQTSCVFTHLYFITSKSKHILFLAMAMPMFSLDMPITVSG